MLGKRNTRAVFFLISINYVLKLLNGQYNCMNSDNETLFSILANLILKFCSRENIPKTASGSQFVTRMGRSNERFCQLAMASSINHRFILLVNNLLMFRNSISKPILNEREKHTISVFCFYEET